MRRFFSSTMTATAIAAGVALLAPLAATAQTPPAAAPAAAATDSRENYAYAMGMLAVVYGFPMVNNTTKRWGMTEKPMGQIDAPVNAFYRVPRAADADDKYSASPTPDVIYNIAWFDVSKEPVVVTVPDAGTRYYGLQMMEMYSDIFGYVGLRSTGNKAGHYLVVGPDWKGTLPAGIADIRRSPTNTGMFILRVHYTENDPKDMEVVRGLQRDTLITPLSFWQAKKPFVAADRDVVDPVLPGSDPLWFFRTLNRGMTESPPPEKDKAIVALLASIGLGPKQSDDLSRLDAPTRAGLQRAQADGMKLLQDVLRSGGAAKVVNQWAYGEESWGRTAQSNDFMARAASQALAGMQEHYIEEVVKLRAYKDSSGELLNGSDRRYVVKFAAGQVPVAKAFWSITLYNEKFDLSANELNRYTRGSNNKSIKYGADGSLELYVQADKPADDKLGNWLPAPRGPFNLFMRAYLPDESLIKQTYVPPPITRVQ